MDTFFRRLRFRRGLGAPRLLHVAERVFEYVDVISADTQDEIDDQDVQELEVLNPEDASCTYPLYKVARAAAGKVFGT